jgi:hypothetical protein
MTAFEKINNILNCKIVLLNGSEFAIPLREDGYIYATGLCKAMGRKISNWYRLKETAQLLSILKDSGITNPIDVRKGGKDKDSQGTWIHPDLGLNLAQWCSVDFSILVSKRLRELIYTGKSELNSERTNEEIIMELASKLREAESKLEQIQSEDTKKSSKKYRTLKSKEFYKLKNGPCVYIIDMKKTYEEEEILSYKIGQTGDINRRVTCYRTSNPFCKVIAVLYTDNHIDLEKILKLKYQKDLLYSNSEFVTGVSKEALKEDLLKLADVFNLKYSMETEEELVRFNRYMILEDDVEEKIPEGMKRCGGLHHQTEESRIQPLSNYFKNKGNTDGHSRLCKECFSIGVYGDKRQKRKVVVIPEHDTTFQKWCNLCETIKEHKDFSSDKTKKDGLIANCKVCRKKMKEKKKASTPPPEIKMLQTEE